MGLLFSTILPGWNKRAIVYNGRIDNENNEVFYDLSLNLTTYKQDRTASNKKPQSTYLLLNARRTERNRVQ